jgi:hypothetical protein
LSNEENEYKSGITYFFWEIFGLHGMPGEINWNEINKKVNKNKKIIFLLQHVFSSFDLALAWHVQIYYGAAQIRHLD